MSRSHPILNDKSGCVTIMGMCNASSVVQSTSGAFISSQGESSKAVVWSMCRGIKHVHRAWYWFRRAKVHTQSDNFLNLIAGHTLNWIAGDNFIVRTAAQVVLVCTRILDCIEEQMALYREGRRFWEGLSGSYSYLPPKVKWVKAQHSHSCSPSTISYCRWLWASFVARLIRILKSTLRIIKHLFLMAMKMMDAISSFSFDPDTKREAVSEFFVNCSKWVELLVQNKDTLLYCLEENRELVACFLQQSCSLFTVDHLINGVKNTINVAEKIHNKVTAASNIVGLVGKDMAQRMAFGLFQTFRVTSMMPDKWVPPMRPPWMQDFEKLKTNEQFPPAWSVQIPVPTTRVQ